MEEKKNDAVKHELFGSNFKCQRLIACHGFLTYSHFVN